jgi:hypothetical protein
LFPVLRPLQTDPTAFARPPRKKYRRGAKPAEPAPREPWNRDEEMTLYLCVSVLNQLDDAHREKFERRFKQRRKPK